MNKHRKGFTYTLHTDLNGVLTGMVYQSRKKDILVFTRYNIPFPISEKRISESIITKRI